MSNDWTVTLYWDGPGFYGGRTNVEAQHRETYKIPESAMEDVTRYCRDRLYDTPFYYKKRPSNNSAVGFTVIDIKDL